MHDEVMAVEEKCDRRIELLTKSMKKCRKRARVDKIEDNDDEWVSSVLLHTEKTRVQVRFSYCRDYSMAVKRFVNTATLVILVNSIKRVFHK